MIVMCDDVIKLAEHVKKENHNIDLDKIAAIDYPFLDTDEKFTILSVPSYHEKKLNIVFVCENTYVLTPEQIN